MKINWKAIPNALNVLGKGIVRHRSSIFVGLGIGGWVATAVLVAKASPKAETAVNQRKKEIFEDLDAEQQQDLDDDFRNVKLPLAEHMRLTWKYYILAGVTGAASTGVICYGHKIDLDEIVKLSGAYKLAKDGYDKLTGKIVEKDGEKKLEEYKRDIREDIIRDNPPRIDEDGNPINIYDTGHGEVIFYFPPTQMYFYSSYKHVEDALRTVIHECENYASCDLSTLIDDLDLPYNSRYFRDYAIYAESVKHYNSNNVHNMLKPKFINANEGDMRVVVFIDVDSLCYNIESVPDDHSGGIFRYR